MLETVEFQALKVEEKDKKDTYINEVLHDFWLSCISREVSLLGRKEALTGKAKFGILGDGKEVPQVAMARAFRKGDFRSGYYRDQTFMFALGLSTIEDFFAQLYADADNDPFSGGRQMNSHFASPLINEKGEWLNHTEQYNISSDISPTAGQMARGMGLAFASKLYRGSDKLNKTKFSDEGNEVCFCTIGDASTSEGIFWEAVNAAGVTQSPLAVSIWDDGFGISVPKKLQTTKGSISALLEGFASEEDNVGFDIYKAKAWDYPALVEMYETGIAKVRETHKPAIFHVEECTQPQGHSTSGSHERYKTPERLQWEKDFDCIEKMKEWIIDSGIATEDKVEQIREEAIAYARKKQKNAWNNAFAPRSALRDKLLGWIDQAMEKDSDSEDLVKLKKELKSSMYPANSELIAIARQLRYEILKYSLPFADELNELIGSAFAKAEKDFHTHLYSETEKSAMRVPIIPATYSETPESLPGHKILNTYFDYILENDNRVYAFGEDVGQIGDVNQGFAGLQDKYGKHRVFDAGIREWTIVGQALGMAMRGLRPIAEIQYLDYLMYALSPLSDDLATLRYRSDGLQKAPAIIRTRGHRLEGIWHAGSPLGMIVNTLRGMHVCVPRNMVQAVGMYNTLLKSDEPGLVIESLNGYRLHENLPSNIGEYTVPLGVPEVLIEGTDITLVTYGSMVRVAEKAAAKLKEMNIHVEVIDVQTLLPFDLENQIAHSIQKTNRVLFVDEDLPGAATAYMMQDVLERQKAYMYLDSAPYTLTARAHRPPYGDDGDYYTKPNEEDIIEKVYAIMHEVYPSDFPLFF